VLQHWCQLYSKGRLKIPYFWTYELFCKAITDITEIKVNNIHGVQNIKEYTTKYPVNREDFSSK
jgi:Ribonuclease G/E